MVVEVLVSKFDGLEVVWVLVIEVVVMVLIPVEHCGPKPNGSNILFKRPAQSSSLLEGVCVLEEEDDVTPSVALLKW